MSIYYRIQQIALDASEISRRYTTTYDQLLDVAPRRVRSRTHDTHGVEKLAFFGFPTFFLSIHPAARRVQLVEFVVYNLLSIGKFI